MGSKIITQDIFNKSLKIYELWKNLNSLVKQIYPRGINFPESVSEPICCYVNSFTLSLGKGSEDAIDKEGNLIQIKATSNFNDDLTSFGPKSKFNKLHFVRLDINNDLLYLYNIPIDIVYSVKVNKNNTVKDLQTLGKRPRFSIIKNIINVYNIKHYAVVNLKTSEITKINL